MALMKGGLAYARVGTQLIDPRILAKAKPDSIIWQHQAEDTQLRYMEACRKAMPDTTFVFEIDDHLAAVDETNWHEAFIADPQTMEERTRRGLALCDRAVVPTAGLEAWLKSLAGPHLPITILPNFLPELDGPLKPIVKRGAGERLRIGWSGGISHGGDLAILGNLPGLVREILGENSPEFIFQGMKPPGIPEALYSWHEGVPPQAYAGKLASLDFDLMLAPIQDSLFNRCKSNLRIVQGGVIGAAILASPVGDYLSCGGAIWKYLPNDPEVWAQAVVEFCQLPEAKRLALKHKARNFSLGYASGRNAQKIAAAWGVERPDTPAKRGKPSVDWVVEGLDPEDLSCLGLRVHRPGSSSVGAAYNLAREERAGLVLARPGTHLPRASLQRLLAALSEPTARRHPASVSCWSNDGATGAGFFQDGKFFQSFEEVGEALAGTLSREAKRRSPEPIRLPFPLGPVVVIPAAMVQRIPAWPEASSFIEAAASWGLVAGALGYEHWLVPGAWATAVAPEPGVDAETIGARGLPFGLLQQSLRSPPALEWRALIEQVHAGMVHEVPAPPGPLQQTLETWLAFYAGAKDETRKPKSLIRIAVGEHSREELAAARRHGFRWIRWDFDGCLVSDGALADLEEAGESSGNSFVYADSMSSFPEAGALPIFLPKQFDWFYGLARDFFTSSLICRADMWQGKAPQSRQDVWEGVMRALQGDGWRMAQHVPKVLAVSAEDREVPGRQARIARLWPEWETSQIAETGLIKAIRKPLEAPAKVIVAPELSLDAESGKHDGLLADIIEYAKNPREAPPVFIITPTTGDPWLLRPMLATLAKHSRYPREIQIILVLSGSSHAHGEALERIKTLKEAHGPGVHVVLETMEDFNFSKACNAGAKYASALNGASKAILVFANDDVRFPQDNWLESLVPLAMESNVGWVGPRIVNPTGALQCAGVYAGGGIAGEVYRNLPGNEIGFCGFAHTTHAVGALTAACVAIQARKFWEIGGFPESLAMNFNDVAVGIEARRRGWLNVYSPHADVMHHTSSTRGKEEAKAFLERIRREVVILGESWPDPDPHWPENLAVQTINRGTMIAGVNLDVLAWPGPGKDAPVALVVGRDTREIAKVLRAGFRVMVGLVVGGALQLANPVLANTPPIKLEDEAKLEGLFRNLGVSRVALGPVPGDEMVPPAWVDLWNGRLGNAAS